jgi:hypothetical protein
MPVSFAKRRKTGTSLKLQNENQALIIGPTSYFAPPDRSKLCSAPIHNSFLSDMDRYGVLAHAYVRTDQQSTVGVFLYIFLPSETPNRNNKENLHIFFLKPRS